DALRPTTGPPFPDLGTQQRPDPSIANQVRTPSQGGARTARRRRRPARASNPLDFHAPALTTPTRSFAHLLAALDGRLHEMTPPLELAQNAFTCHLALEMLDGALDALVSDLDLEGLALD